MVANVGKELGFQYTIQGRDNRILERTCNEIPKLFVDNFEEVADNDDIYNFFNCTHFNRETSGRLPKNMYVKDLLK